jgi:hypothetical protein
VHTLTGATDIGGEATPGITEIIGNVIAFQMLKAL